MNEWIFKLELCTIKAKYLHFPVSLSKVTLQIDFVIHVHNGLIYTVHQ